MKNRQGMNPLPEGTVGLQFLYRFVQQEQDCGDCEAQGTGKQQDRRAEGLQNRAGQDRSDGDHTLGADADD